MTHKILVLSSKTIELDLNKDRPAPKESATESIRPGASSIDLDRVHFRDVDINDPNLTVDKKDALVKLVELVNEAQNKNLFVLKLARDVNEYVLWKLEPNYNPVRQPYTAIVARGNRQVAVYARAFLEGIKCH